MFIINRLRSLALWFARTPRRWGLLVAYLALLTASHLYVRSHPAMIAFPTPADAIQSVIETPAFTKSGVSKNTPPVNVGVLEWAPKHPDPAKLPIVLIHCSPGEAAVFSRLAPKLAAQGRRAIAFDLPGFGASSLWVPDYSVRAHARYALEAMTKLGVKRAHILGFSMGGGVALNMVDLAPDRVASLTMLSAIGVQEAEGSGSYAFEHTKYGIGYALLVALPKAIPHFGLLGPPAPRHAFIRNFWDTDQRPLRKILKSLTTPTLILQGRNDPLVYARAGEEHHRLVGPSSLVIFDASHFMVFRNEFTTKLVANLAPFLTRHDTPGVAALRFEVDQAPVAHATGINLGPFRVLRTSPWWLLFWIIIIATWISEDATVITVGILIAHGQIDWGVGLIGCFTGIVMGDGGLWAIGRFAGRRALHWPFIRDWVPEKSLERWGRWFDRHTIQAVFVARAVPGLRLPTYLAAGLLSKRTHGFLFWAALAAFLWTPILLILSTVLGPRLLNVFEQYFGGPLGVVLSIVVLFVGVRLVSGSFTWLGRRKLTRDFKRLVRSEFWPKWVFYLPLAPWMAWQAIHNRGVMSFTCLNPDVPHGGGVVGESKYEIIQGLVAHSQQWVVRTHFIADDLAPERRADLVEDLTTNDPKLGGYPVVLKPDESQMGHAFKVVRSRAEAQEYFADMTRAALLQAFDPGPLEAGVLWARDLKDGVLQPTGHIFSITKKEFPSIVGDGKSTLERLIWKHPRYSMQADIFIKRFSDKTDLVLEQGERMGLGVAGNHAQGTMFLDGADLITPQLEARIDEIARNFSRTQRAEGAPGGFDFGRFDIRYASEDVLKRGEAFAIVELNGAMSESTNLYDPRRSVLWTYSVLFEQWKRMYRLGGARRKTGVRPMSALEVLKATRDHFKGRPGSTVAD